jgi:hypothetical protein
VKFDWFKKSLNDAIDALGITRNDPKWLSLNMGEREWQMQESATVFEHNLFGERSGEVAGVSMAPYMMV